MCVASSRLCVTKLKGARETGAGASALCVHIKRTASWKRGSTLPLHNNQAYIICIITIETLF